MPDYLKDKAAAAKWAFDLLEDGNFVVLDTESTALKNAKIVQIAIVDSQGNELLNSLVNPEIPIPSDAMAIHGITDEMVKDAPTIDQLADQIQAITDGKTLIIYNANYDYPILKRLMPDWTHPDVQCCMERYAEFYGDFNDYFGSYRWQKLKGGDHSAIGDALATLSLLHLMANETPNL